VVVALALASVASAHPDRAPLRGHPSTCDGQGVTQHLHRARVLLREAYESGPDRELIGKAQAHRRCIRIASVRQQIGELRDRLKAELEQRQALSDITPPGPEYLAALRQCESGGNYSTNTGNGFYGAYQFTLSTWESVGGSGYPHLAAPAEQDYRAAYLWRTGGPGHWPNCP
jgi:hypothetical protein